jgi:hypothetical protein
LEGPEIAGTLACSEFLAIDVDADGAVNFKQR